MEIIEIPFGAKDSELQEWTYTIPEGMEAEIKDGRIIIKRKESDDERIRKDLIKYLESDRDCQPCQDVSFYDSSIAWLEKQKKQKSVECIKFDNEFENQISRLIASVLNGEYEYNEGFVKYVAQSLLNYAKNELKPAEWSEDDENNIGKLHRLLVICQSEKKFIPTSEYEKLDKWLKSLRPQPKQEWGEEDEHRRNDAIYFLETAKKHYADTSEIELTVAWLKSLRPQPKNEIHKKKNEEPKHTEVWVEGRTIFEQDANSFVNTEKEPEAKLTGWVVRDRSGEIWVHDAYPKKEYEIWVEGRYLPLNQNSFPDLKWEDEPVEVEITIRRK